MTFTPRSLVCAVLACALMAFTSAQAHTAGAPPKVAAFAADMEKGMWSVYEPGCFGPFFACYVSQETYIDGEIPKNPFPLKPEYAAEFAKIQGALKEGKSIFDPDAQCYPSGVPTRLRQPFKMAFQADSILILQGGAEYRIVYMDGRKIPTEDPALYTFNGRSVGHWEGDTLVIETRNIIGPNTQLAPHIPKSDNFWIKERYTPLSADLMDYTIEMMDEDRWTRHFIEKYQFRRNAKAEPGPIQPCIAGDGQRYIFDAQGVLNLTGAGGEPLQKAED